LPKRPDKLKAEDKLPPGHKLQRSRSGKTMVILPPGLQDWQDPADLVEAFDGIKQENLDELDDYLMGVDREYSRQTIETGESLLGSRGGPRRGSPRTSKRGPLATLLGLLGWKRR
jgi:hypothetical protein